MLSRTYPAEPGQVRVARAAVAGTGNWGIDGDARGRVAWAWLGYIAAQV